MATRPNIRVLICDDHPVFRTGLRGMFSSQPDFEVVGEAANGVEAVTLAGRTRPDVVLMDLRMPEMDGIGAISRIKLDYPETYILVLTTYETDADILKALEGGATGFLLKDASHEELFSAVREVAAGRSPLSLSAATRLVRRFRDSAPKTSSTREIEILRLAARGFSNKAIARELFISEATVKSHFNHLFDKLGVTDRTSAVVEALKRGIIRLEP